MAQVSSKIDTPDLYIRSLLYWEVIVRDRSIDKYNTFYFCGWLMQRLRDIIALVDLPFSLSLVFFWWTAALLLLLRKAFPTVSVHSTASLAENGRGNILKMSTNVSELPDPLLDHFISSSSHFCTPFLDRPSRSIFGTPPKQSSNFGTGRVGTPPDSLCSSPEVYTPWDSVLPRSLYKLRG